MIGPQRPARPMSPDEILSRLRGEDGQLRDAPLLSGMTGDDGGSVDRDDSPSERPRSPNRPDPARLPRQERPTGLNLGLPTGPPSFGTTPLLLGEYQPSAIMPYREFEQGFTQVGVRQPDAPAEINLSQAPDPIDPFAPYINELNQAATAYNNLASIHRQTNVVTPELLDATSRYWSLLGSSPDIPGSSPEFLSFRDLARQEVEYTPLPGEEQILGRTLDTSPLPFFNPFSLQAPGGEGLQPGSFASQYLNSLSDAGVIDPGYLWSEDTPLESRFEPGAEQYAYRGVRADLPGYSPEGLSYQYRHAAYDPFGHLIRNNYWQLPSDADTSGQRYQSVFLPDAPYVIQGYGGRFAAENSTGRAAPVTPIDPSREHTSLGRNPTLIPLVHGVEADNKAQLSDQPELATLPLSGTPLDVPVRHDADGALRPMLDYQVGRGFDEGLSVPIELQYIAADAENPYVRDRSGMAAVEYAPEQAPDSRQYVALNDLRLADLEGTAGEASGMENDLRFLGGDYDFQIHSGNLPAWWGLASQNRGVRPDTSFSAEDITGIDYRANGVVATANTGNVTRGQFLNAIDRPWAQRDEFDLPALPLDPDDREEERFRQETRYRSETNYPDQIFAHHLAPFLRFRGTNLDAVYLGNELRSRANGSVLQGSHIGPYDIYYYNPSSPHLGVQRGRSSGFTNSFGRSGPTGIHFGQANAWVRQTADSPHNWRSLNLNIAHYPVLRDNQDPNVLYVELGNRGWGGQPGRAAYDFNPNGQAFSRNVRGTYVNDFGSLFSAHSGRRTGQSVRDFYGITRQVPYQVNIPYTVTVPGDPTINGRESRDALFAWSDPYGDGMRRLLFGGQRVDQNNIRARVPSAAPLP